VSAADIDAYLAAVPEPKKSTLEEMRRRILRHRPGRRTKDFLPNARLCGERKVVAGFAAFKNHLAFLPHSGRVLSQLDRELTGFVRTLSSLHFAIDQPLSEELIAKLIEAKMRVLEGDGEWQRPE